MQKARFNKILTKSFLQKYYVKEKLNTYHIAKTVNCSAHTVSDYLKKHRIEVRDSKKENNGNWVDGKWGKEYKCIEYRCNNLVCSITHFKGQGRCSKCRSLYDNPFKGKKHTTKTKKRISKTKRKYYEIYKSPNYKDGRCSKNHYCIDCEKEIHYKTALYGEGRCNSCSNKGELHSRWIKDRTKILYPLGWNKTFKEQIRFRDKYKCQLCKCHEVECNRKLHVHHIDYDKNNLVPINLISLCNSCHMKTNADRENWKKIFGDLICS